MKHSLILSALTLMAGSLLSGCHQRPDSIEALTSEYVTLDDSIQIHYKQWGNGPRTVMFVHGFGCDMRAWEAQYDAFYNPQNEEL